MLISNFSMSFNLTLLKHCFNGHGKLTKEQSQTFFYKKVSLYVIKKHGQVNFEREKKISLSNQTGHALKQLINSADNSIVMINLLNALFERQNPL